MKEKNKLCLPFSITRAKIIAAIVLLTVIDAAIIVPIVCINLDKQSRQYSKEKADTELQLMFKPGSLGEFKVIETNSKSDGRYSEHVLGKNAVDIKIWRDFTRPKMSCQKQIKEKYPDMRRYSRQKTSEDSIVSEKAMFSVKDDNGITHKHTVVLLRKSGWDYLVDFAVKEEDGEKYSDYIDKLINGLFYL